MPPVRPTRRRRRRSRPSTCASPTTTARSSSDLSVAIPTGQDHRDRRRQRVRQVDAAARPRPPAQAAGAARCCSTASVIHRLPTQDVADPARDPAAVARSRPRASPSPTSSAAAATRTRAGSGSGRAADEAAVDRRAWRPPARSTSPAGPVDELSGGQRQRVWIAMTLAQGTALMLLDEPTTFLDLAHQVEVLDLLVDLNQREGRTIVLVLHDLNQACRYSHHLIAMRDGRDRRRGRPGRRRHARARHRGVRPAAAGSSTTRSRRRRWSSRSAATSTSTPRPDARRAVRHEWALRVSERRDTAPSLRDTQCGDVCRRHVPRHQLGDHDPLPPRRQVPHAVDDVQRGTRDAVRPGPRRGPAAARGRATVDDERRRDDRGEIGRASASRGAGRPAGGGARRPARAGARDCAVGDAVPHPAPRRRSDARPSRPASRARGRRRCRRRSGGPCRRRGSGLIGPRNTIGGDPSGVAHREVDGDHGAHRQGRRRGRARHRRRRRHGHEVVGHGRRTCTCRRRRRTDRSRAGRRAAPSTRRRAGHR